MKRQIASVLALFVLATSVCAADAVRMLEDFSVKIQSAAGRFTQTESEDGKVLASGRFSFTHPGKFLWETQSPFSQAILCNGKTLWIYDPDLHQVTVRELKQAAGLGPAALLFGQTSPGELFNLSDRGKIGNLFWVQATPKTSDAAFPAMEVGLDEKGFVRELRLTDSFGEVTLYKLSDLQVPSDLKTQDYEFRIPPGTDVLQDTSQQ